jgi:peptidoglycan/LPS O-acetylase OafA/YrhL
MTPTETKVNVAATAAAGGGLVLHPLVLYLMTRLLGEDPTDPLVVGAATVIAALLVAAVTWWAGRAKRSATSAVSEGFDPQVAQQLEQQRHAARRQRPRRDTGQL